MPSRLTFTLLVAALLIPRLLCAAALDDAPFRVVVPSSGWQITNSTAQPMGRDVFLVATISNTNGLLKSIVAKAVLAKESDSSLEELCAGMRNSFANPVVKKISEAETKFLGHKARTFIYHITQGGQTIYNEATVFVADGKGWTILCAGPLDQQDEIGKIFDFYRKKTG